MLKIEEQNDPESCWNRAEWAEPTFILLGRDSSAPTAIRGWTIDRVRRGKNNPDDAQILEAFALADMMDRYRKQIRPEEEPKTSPVEIWQEYFIEDDEVEYVRITLKFKAGIDRPTFMEGDYMSMIRAIEKFKSAFGTLMDQTKHIMYPSVYPAPAEEQLDEQPTTKA